MLKNSRVNQSISAATARLSVAGQSRQRGHGGRPSSKARSAGAVLMVAPTDTSENHSGNHRWRCHWVLAICLRQRHSVQMARGHAGQPNHSSSRARLAHSLPPASAHQSPAPQVELSPRHQRRSRHQNQSAATHLRWWAMSTLALRHTSQAPPRPSMAARQGHRQGQPGQPGGQRQGRGWRYGSPARQIRRTPAWCSTVAPGSWWLRATAGQPQAGQQASSPRRPWRGHSRQAGPRRQKQTPPAAPRASAR